ncbi:MULTISPECIES: hypothetical protein [Pseudomonas]|uniref:hypothetical protein n=1 Tax=Pseudomonas TaxID=286 RepID=UPI0004123321|nr:MULTISPECIES: hypothetical protein [Pseudomonas]MBK5004543.1 hypothetical protein [Pseudomonas sp. S32]
MSQARKQVTLANLSEFARLMPKGLPHDEVIAAMSSLSLKCSLNYELSKTFLVDGWIVEYRHLRTAAQLAPVNDLLLFTTSGGLQIKRADGTQQLLESGDQVVLPADSEATVYPVGRDDKVSFIALSMELDLGQVLQEIVD